MQIPKGRLKQVLACIGGIYVVLVVAYVVYAAVNWKSPSGPSELELNPEKQAELRAQRSAEMARERLNLSPEQTAAVTEIFKKNLPTDAPPAGGPGEQFRAIHEEIDKVLTPEQRAAEEQMRGRGPGGPGGPGGPPGMNPERMDALKEAMTPEQKERFEKQMERMRQRMPMGMGRRNGPPPPQ
jgi:Spy/CpxP family protein refolding chaperone